MLRKTWAISAIIALFLVPVIANGIQCNQMEFYTDKSYYTQGEVVSITMENIGSGSIYGEPSYSITDESGNLVMGKVRDTLELRPGENTTLPWRQMDIDMDQISPGTYTIHCRFGVYSDTLKIEIGNEGQRSMEFYTDKPCYSPGEGVIITMKNISNKTLYGRGFFHIASKASGPIWIIVILDTELKPGKKITIWDEAYNPGAYRIDCVFDGYYGIMEIEIGKVLAEN